MLKIADIEAAIGRVFDDVDVHSDLEQKDYDRVLIVTIRPAIVFGGKDQFKIAFGGGATAEKPWHGMSVLEIEKGLRKLKERLSDKPR